MNQSEKIKMRVAKGGIKLSAGQAVNQGLSFLKNVIIARLLSPSDYGVAATFAITLSIVEVTSNIAADKLIIQSQEGETEEFQATIQFMQFIRGCINAAILLLLGSPVATLFG